MKTESQKKNKFFSWIYFWILVFLIFFLFFNKYGIIKYFELKKEIDVIEMEIDNSEKEIKKMDDNIESLKNNEKELEKVAREKFHMKKKNEKAYRFYDKKDSNK